MAVEKSNEQKLDLTQQVSWKDYIGLSIYKLGWITKKWKSPPPHHLRIQTNFWAYLKLWNTVANFTATGSEDFFQENILKTWLLLIVQIEFLCFNVYQHTN